MYRPGRQAFLFGGCVALLVGLWSTLRVAVVQGESMLPTFGDGQIVLVNRLAYVWHGPRRGDVVLLRRANDVLIKRIAYLPGEAIPAKTAPAFRSVIDQFDKPSSASGSGLVVPRGAVVVLGDNPANSEDSRAFGPVRTGDLLGRVLGAPPRP